MTRVDLLVPQPAAMMSRMLVRALEGAVRPHLAEEPATEACEGASMRRYRLDLPEDATIDVPLGAWGSAGIGVEDGRVCLDAPLVAAAVLRTAAGRAVHAVRGLPQGRRRVVLDLQPGSAVRIPLGSAGKLLVRLAP